MLDDAAVQRLIDEAERAFRRKYNGAVEWLRERRTVEAIARLIAERRYDSILTDAELTRAASSIATEVNAAHIRAAEKASQELARVTDSLVRYDVGNPRAVRAMQENKLRLVREIGQEQRDVLRSVLADGIGRGENPLTTARAVRQSIGLTTRQAEHVNNYRRLLEKGSTEALTRELRDRRFDGMVERATETPLTPEQIDRMVSRYRARYVKYRSEVIARTEGLRSVHQGQMAGFEQAIADGEIQSEQLELVWHPAPRTENHRPQHQVIKPVPYGQPFISGSGIALRYPGDPLAPASETLGCRCTFTTRIVAVAVRSPGTRVPGRDEIPALGSLERRVRARDLRQAGLEQFGDVSGDASLARYRRLRDEGSMPPPIKVTVDRDGKMFLEDGRHRFAVTDDGELIDVIFTRQYEDTSKRGTVTPARRLVA